MGKFFCLKYLALATVLLGANTDQTPNSSTPNLTAPTETTATPITDTNTASPTANSASITMSPNADNANMQTTYTSMASPATTSASTQTTSDSHNANMQTTYTSTASPATTSASTQTTPDSHNTSMQTPYTSTASPATTSASTQTTPDSHNTNMQTTYTSTASPATTSASTQTTPDSHNTNMQTTYTSTASPATTSASTQTTPDSPAPLMNSSTVPPTESSKDPLTNSSTAPPAEPSKDPLTNSSTAPPTESSKDPLTNSSTAPPAEPSKDTLTNSSTAPPTESSKDPLTNSSTAPPAEPSKDTLTNSSTASATITRTTPFININMASPTLTPHSSPDSSTSTTATETYALNSTTTHTNSVVADICDYNFTQINQTENEVILKIDSSTGQNLTVVCDNKTKVVMEANQIFHISNLPLCARFNCSINPNNQCNYADSSREVEVDLPSPTKFSFTIVKEETSNHFVYKVQENGTDNICNWDYEWNCTTSQDIHHDSFKVLKNETFTSCNDIQCSVKVLLQQNHSQVFTHLNFNRTATLQTPSFNISNNANTSISGCWNAVDMANVTANITTNVNRLVGNENTKICKVTDNAFDCKGLTPYTNYRICLKAQLLCNGIEYESTECSVNQTAVGIPGPVLDPEIKVHSNNAILITCKAPENSNGPNLQYVVKLKNGDLQTKKECNFLFEDLRYHTTYTIEIWAKNSKYNGSIWTKDHETSYNDGALITFLVFLIVLTSIALIVVLWKIYSLQKKSSRDGDEDIELIDHDDEKQLLNVDPILAEHLLDAFRSKQADEARLFLAEFQSIPRVFNKFHVKEARKSCNSNKNRYVDILPYDHNRVSLTPVTATLGSDYINASYIDGFNEPKKYIAAQGPKDETSDEFWKMVWEQKATSIVMVTRCEEGNRPKCAQYWPTLDEQNKSFGDLVIRIGEEKWCPDYVVRKLFILHKKEKPTEREVTHIQFISWPDHGVPEDPQLLLKLRRRVNSFSNFFSGPIIVHCSAGVGRTGSYIGIDAMMQGLEAEGRVDIYGYVVKLRRQRCLMVQVEAQYILIHQALLEHYIFGDTEISLSELPKDLINLKRKDPVSEPSMLDAEFQRVPLYETKLQKSGKLAENQSKNRSISVIPFEYNRVTVKLVDEKSKESENDSEMDSDDDDDDLESTKYINASFIDGYWHSESLIATQAPLQETIADFWQMVFQKKTGFIVMLSKLTENTEDFTEYWGEEDKTYEDVEVKLTECNKGPEFIVRTFEIKCGKRKEARKVHQYHYHKWADSDLPEDPSSFIKMIRTLKEKLPKHNGPNRAIVPPIVVHCSDGGKLSGMFCAMWNLVDSADTENIIDIFNTVKLLRKQRLGMIPTLGQFEFLYDTIASTYPVQNGTLKSSGSSPKTTVEIISESPFEESKQDAVLVSDEKSKEVSAIPAEEKKPESDSTNDKQPAENPINGPLTATANE